MVPFMRMLTEYGGAVVLFADYGMQEPHAVDAGGIPRSSAFATLGAFFCNLGQPNHFHRTPEL
jgi:hypothetical protein